MIDTFNNNIMLIILCLVLRYLECFNYWVGTVLPNILNVLLIIIHSMSLFYIKVCYNFKVYPQLKTEIIM